MFAIALPVAAQTAFAIRVRPHRCVAMIRTVALDLA